jgi:hypothetical protein
MERIVIALTDRSPLNGQIEAPGQPDRPFDGWLGLLSALHAATGALAAEREGRQRVLNDNTKA